MSAVFSAPPEQWNAPPALAFRAFSEADVLKVAAIEADVYVFPWSAGNFRDSLFSGYRCIGAWVDKELVSYAVVMTALDEAHLLNLAVAKDWQQRGVGALMLTHIIEELKAIPLEMIYLEVRPSNLAGRRLYERFGFKQLGMRPDYYPALAGREDALFLGLNIVPGLNIAPTKNT